MTIPSPNLCVQVWAELALADEVVARASGPPSSGPYDLSMELMALVVDLRASLR